MARLLAAAPDDRVRDGKAALSIVEQLVKIEKTPALGETMAMTLAELGRYPEAISWQREAIAAAKQAGRSEMTAGMAENLKLYERRQPCRTPWRQRPCPLSEAAVKMKGQRSKVRSKCLCRFSRRIEKRRLHHGRRNLMRVRGRSEHAGANSRGLRPLRDR